jgi:hypothetical protein
MQPIRQLLTAFSFAIAVWLVGSVVGVVADPVRAEFWTASMMWALLAALMIAPALVMLYDPSIGNSERTETGSADSSASDGSQKSFVDDARTAPVSEEPSSEAEESLPEWVQERSE